jgi:uncharacterized membrane protein
VAAAHSPASDTRLQQAIGNLLRVGVLLAATVVLAGGVLFLARRGASVPSYQVFRGEPEELKSLGGIMRSALSLNERGVVQLGVLLLIATPVARVALAAVGFAFERDRTYVLITLLVLSLLLKSLSG